MNIFIITSKVKIRQRPWSAQACLRLLRLLHPHQYFKVCNKFTNSRQVYGVRELAPAFRGIADPSIFRIYKTHLSLVIFLDCGSLLPPLLRLHVMNRRRHLGAALQIKSRL